MTKITQITKTYTLTASGKSWKSKPDEITRKEVSKEYYNNYVASIPFFNGLFGGTCRGRKTYTTEGYIYTRVTTIDPSRTEKTVVKFDFDLI